MPTIAPTVKLNNGRTMPAFGLGTFQATPGAVRDAVKHAISVGYRHIDTAAVYLNETEIGEALQEKFADGTVKREDMFITSKEGDNNHPTENGAAATADIDYVDTWKQMEECVRLGLAKNIGVSNFNSKQLTRVLEKASIKPVTNQVECHPYLNQQKLIDFCKQRDILITAYSPLANPSMKMPDGGVPLLEHPKIKELAAKYKKTVAQVVLRYVFQLGTVPIPKSYNKSRIEENIQIFDFNLSDDDMAYIKTFNRNYRIFPFAEAGHDKHYPFHAEF